MNNQDKRDLALVWIDASFVAIGMVAARLGKLPELPGWALVPLLGLASFRAGRAISFNFAFIWLRQLLGVVELPDSSGAGNNNHATGSGARFVLGELVTCPICSGTWAAMIMLAVYAMWPQVGQVFIYALAAAGVAELAHWASESLQWGGRLAREVSGKYNHESQAPGAGRNGHNKDEQIEILESIITAIGDMASQDRVTK